MLRDLVRTFLIVCIFSIRAHAQEAALESAPIEGDAENLRLPSSTLFEQLQEPQKAGAFSIRETLSELPAFFKDTTLKVNIRNFYFARQDGADAPGNDKEKISWALGGSAALKTGKLYDVFTIGAEVFTSQKLYGPDDKDGALLLEPGQNGYTVLGVANPRIDYGPHVLTTYRQRHDLPYVNNQENRMTPNTFESYGYIYKGEGDKPPFQLGVGYLDKIKKRNSDEFVSMSEGAGVTQGDRGMPFLGVRVRPTDDIKVVAINYAGLDFLNIFYSDLEHTYKVSDDVSLKSSAQFSQQQSIGDDLLLGDDIGASMYGLQEAVSYRKFMVRAALTVDDQGTTMRSPFGSYPGYNSSIVEDFNRAGEIAWKLGVSYDFAGVGLDGVSSYVDFIQGNRAVTDTKETLPDKNELDVNIDYKIKEGMFNGIWLRLRSGFVHEETVGTTKDFRVIFNYDFSIL